MGINYEYIGGNCPVQADGTFDGVPFYFRARGERWSVEVGIDPPSFPLKDGNWYYEEPYGDTKFSAGWMDVQEAYKFIEQAYQQWRDAMDKPKIIYKYTHAQAVESGELRLIAPDKQRTPSSKPVYIGYQVDAKFKENNVSDNAILEVVHNAIFNIKNKSKKRITTMIYAMPIDVVLGEEIRDDDQRVECITVVLQGET